MARHAQSHAAYSHAYEVAIRVWQYAIVVFIGVLLFLGGITLSLFVVWTVLEGIWWVTPVGGAVIVGAIYLIVHTIRKRRRWARGEQRVFRRYGVKVR